MRIGIDARRMEGRPTGVGRYLMNLLREWGSSGSSHEYVLYFSNGTRTDSFLKDRCFTQRVLTDRPFFKVKTLWEQIYLPFHLVRHSPDLFFSPHYFIPLGLHLPSVVTIHDISYTVRAQEFPFWGRLKYHWASRWSAVHAKRVITTSFFSKQEIMEHYKIPEPRIVVIPLAADASFKPLKDPLHLETVKAKYELSGPFILYIGTIFNRRNVLNLIMSFKRVIEKHPGIKLMIIGENLLRPRQDLRQWVSDLGLGEQVVWCTYVPEEDLAPLYCASEVFVYPSAYEGFGLPILEAMACGTPVITTRSSSLPEVAGDAGLYVDPKSIEDFSSTMVRVLENSFLRAELREKGFKQAAAFSWDKTAQATLAVFEDAVASQ